MIADARGAFARAVAQGLMRPWRSWRVGACYAAGRSSPSMTEQGKCKCATMRHRNHAGRTRDHSAITASGLCGTCAFIAGARSMPWQTAGKPSIFNVRTNPISSFFMAFAALLLLIVFNHWLFTQLDFKTGKIDYLQWYFTNAAAIGIGSALFSTIWGTLDKRPDVISAHPMRFAAAYMELIALFYLAISTSIRVNRPQAPTFDWIAGMLLSVILAVVLMLGLLVIGPLQYFMFLICGSFARFVSQSDLRLIMHKTDDSTDLREIRDDEEVPPDWQDISLKNRPFTLTNVIVGRLAGVLKFVEFDKLF